MSLEWFWLLQYPIAAIIAAVVGISLYWRNRGSYAYFSFLAYGMAVSAWMMFVYLHRLAQTEESTAMYLKLSSWFFTSVFPLLLITLSNIAKRNIFSFVLLIPMIVEQIIHHMMADYKFIKTSFGWSYLLKFPNLYASMIIYFIHFMYLIAFAIILFLMITKLKIPKIYKKRYSILFISLFGIQGIAVIIMQFLLQEKPDLPPTAGIFNIVSFLITTYTLRLEKISVSTEHPVEDWERPEKAFTYFLENYYSSLKGTELGEAALRFQDFLTVTNISQFVEKTDTGYSVKIDGKYMVDFIDVLDNILFFLEKTSANNMVVQYLGYFLFTIHQHAIQNRNIDKFNKRIIEKNLGFLLKSDILYELPVEYFRKLVDTDSSLDLLEDWRAATKLYKRMISQLTLPQLYFEHRSELVKRTKMYNLTQYLEFDPIGKAIYDESDIEMRVPESKLDAVIESFNAFLVWAVEYFYAVSEETGQEVLKRLKDVIALNQRTALRLRIYAALLSSLSSRLSSDRLKNLYITSGEMLGQLNAFSQRFNLSHQYLVGRVVLLEFDPRTPLTQLMNDLATEARNNGERLIVFTRRKSDLDMALLEVDKYYLSTPGRRPATFDEKIIPMNDITALLGTLSLVAADPFTCIVFDSITDLCMNLGQEAAYSAMRHMTDLLGKAQAPFILMLNPRAHPPEAVSAFETLSNVILAQDGDSLRVLKS